MDTTIAQAADYLSANNILNCYVNEFNHWQLEDCPTPLREAGFPNRVLIIPAGQQRLWVGIQHWSCCGRHRFLMPVRSETVANGNFRHLKFVYLAQALVDNAVHQTKGSFSSAARLVEMISENRRNLEILLTIREKDFLKLFQGRLSYRHSEQALLSGHPGNPIAKIRRPMTLKDSMQFAPEGGSGFPLTWIQVRQDLIQYQSTDKTPLAKRLQDLIAADDHLRRLPQVPDGYALIPAHPWQLCTLQKLPQLAQAFRNEDIKILEPSGKRWHPTSAMNTLYAEHAPYMLQFSLNVQPDQDGVFMTLADMQAQMDAVQFSVEGAGPKESPEAFHAPSNVGWLSLIDDNGEPLPESIVMFRNNPIQEHTDRQYNSLAALTQDHPWAEQSRLYWQVKQWSETCDISLTDAATEWFSAYLNNILSPLLTAQHNTQWCWRTKSSDLVLILKNGLPDAVLFQGNHCCVKGNECGVNTEASAIQQLLLESVFDVISTLEMDGLADENKLIEALRKFLVQHPAVGLRVDSIIQPILVRTHPKSDGFFRTVLGV